MNSRNYCEFLTTFFNSPLSKFSKFPREAFSRTKTDDGLVCHRYVGTLTNVRRTDTYTASAELLVDV